MRDAHVVVIGAGQAGLAASFHLGRMGIDHVVLEQGRVAETWRSRRWDAFTLVSPNWTFDLPGFPYDGPDPDGFMDLDEIVGRFELYADIVSPPLETGVRVLALQHDDNSGRFQLLTSAGDLTARHVVVATGAYQRPRIPVASISSDVLQLHTDGYRRPEQLPDGGVLVVGSGQSGCQIAEELCDAGRKVYLSTGSCGWLPRRYRGRDNVAWRVEMGVFDDTLDVLPNLHARTACPAIQTGRGAGRDLNLCTLAERGVVLAGRFVEAQGTLVHFAGDLEANIAACNATAERWRQSVDMYIEAGGLAAPVEPALPPPTRLSGIESLDLAQAGAGTVLWATGYKLDFSWIDLELFDADGYPIQKQGVSPCPGLYFVGLHWMYKRKSGVIFGVGEDAANVCRHIATRWADHT
jgi:putative flavoprotein involved in K+ transport